MSNQNAAETWWEAIHRKDEEKKREKQAAKEAKQRKKDKHLLKRCTYIGSFPQHESLRTKAKNYWFEMDESGLRVTTTWDQNPLLDLSWDQVAAIELDDVSRMEIKSRVEQRGGGGMGGLSWTWSTQPVARTYSKQIDQTKLMLDTSEGKFIFTVMADPLTLEGKLMLVGKAI